MTIQLILFEIAIGIAILGGVAAYKRSIGERLCALGSVIISYALAFLITKLGAFDAIAKAVVGYILSIKGVGELLSASSAAGTSVEAIVASIARPILMTLLFVLLLIIFKIATSIILPRLSLDKKCSLFRVDEKKKGESPVAIEVVQEQSDEKAEDGEADALESAPAEKEQALQPNVEEKAERSSFGFIWKRALACVIGALTFYSVAMLSYLPLATVENLVKPAVEMVQTEQYDGTYVQDIAKIAGEHFLPSANGTLYGGLQKYTGFSAILNATASSLSEHTVVNNEGEKMQVNFKELIQRLVCNAADVVAVYEYTCRPDDHTLGDVLPVTDVIESLSNEGVLIDAALEILEKVEQNADQGKDKAEKKGIATDLLNFIKDSYLGKDASVVQSDLKVVSELAKTLISDNKDTGLRDKKYIPALLDYLAVSENAEKTVAKMSELNVYEGAFDLLAGFGINALCDTLKISEDQEAYYREYLTSVYEAVNERADGEFYSEHVEAFIRYAAENGITVSEYKIADAENLTETDFAYTNYKHFISQMQRFESLFVAYLIDDKNAASVYTAEDGTLFVYDGKADTWTLCESEQGLRAGSLAAQLMADRVREIFDEDIEHTISEEEIKVLAAEIIAQLGGDINASEARKESAVALLGTLMSNEGFDPNGAVYRAEILDALKKGGGFDDEQNKQFASILTTVASFAKDVYGKTDVGIELYMQNFSVIGRVLDNLQKMDKTSDIPEKMLIAITQHKDFGKYFVSDSIIELSQSVKNGTSTYEALFEQVHAFYNIVNQIIPE